MMRSGAARGGFTQWAAALCMAALPLIATADDRAAREQAMATRALDAVARQDFAVPASAPLDAPLRARLEALSREHVARVGGQNAAWAAELAALAGGEPGARAWAPLQARYVNELVRWQTDRVDEADDQRLLRRMAHPQACVMAWGQTAFAGWVKALPHLPEADREAAVQAQATLLARWGQPRAEAPVRPALPWLSQAQAALRRAVASPRPADEPPLPELLAQRTSDALDERVTPDLRCALAVWSLQRAPWQGAPVADQARLLRWALAWDPLHDGATGKRSAVDDDYPFVARALGVEGRVRVTGQVSASGTGLDNARVAWREVRVEGLGATPLVAFEGVFDDASLQRAARTPTAGRAAGATLTFEFVWKLD
jgi:hypothetical protein